MLFQSIIRTALAAMVGVAALLGTAAHAAYPERTVTLVVNYPPGGPLDLVARLVAEHASEELGQPVIVENRGGAAGSIGGQHVARQKPDGYTLLMSVDTVSTVNPFVYTSSTFNANETLTPITMAGSFNQVLAVRPDLEADALENFVALAKDDELTYSSAGIAAPGHLTMEQFIQAQSLSMVHIPYKGNAPATVALLSGEVDAGFLAIAGTIEHLKAGKLVPLVVSGKKRDALLPDVPTIAESGIPGLEDFDVEFGYVLMAPKGTPTEVLDQWSALVAKAFEDPAVLERLEALNINPIHGTPQETEKRLEADAQHWEAVVKKANISVN